MKPITPPLRPNMQGDEVANLHEVLQFFLSRGVFKVNTEPGRITPDDLAAIREKLEVEAIENIYGGATTELVRLFQIQIGLGSDLRGVVEERTARVMNELLRQLGAFDRAPGEEDYTVSGVVHSNQGVALVGYAVEAEVIGLRQNISVGKAVTGRSGEYMITYKNPLDTDPDIEVKAYDLKQRSSVGSSGIKYNATPVERLDVIIGSERIIDESEFSRLVSDIGEQLNDVRLTDLKEDEENQDITYLSNKTGWDGRITAMAVSAHQLGEALKIEPDHVYAMLRAGIPATEDDIKSLSAEKVKAIVGQAAEKNVITGIGNLDGTLEVLNFLSIDYLLNTKFPSSVSSMSDMLALRLNGEQQQIFAQTQKQVGEENQKLWSELGERGFSADTIAGLQLDGKLGFLTGQNVPLMKKVYENFNLQRDVDLASSGLYKSAEWASVIEDDVPEGITAEAYAQYLANQVKLSYPTAVVAEMINNDEIFSGQEIPKDELTAFLYANEADHNIGLHPVKTWEGFEQLSPEAQASAKSVERMYQITPSDESMTALSNAGITSAYQITKSTKKEFINALGDQFPSVEEAEKTYQKAQEVYSAALGVATTYLTTQTLPNIYAISGKPEKEQHEIVANPTLEELLGNMDYCDCDHCKSVLSPAAYLVELLQFIDLEDVPHAKSNPIDALKARRPDIENILLSCENTNIALPYIDLVNEILEYYIVNGNLTDLKGHDVVEGTSQTELLAEPQFVNEAAYDLLKTRVFPYSLPFHQPLETLRRLFQTWDTSLEYMLAAFATPLSSRKESLGLNEDEYRALTDSAFKKLPEYFGEPENNSIAQLNAALANGKAFSRRLGISYEDLVELLETRFVNPDIDLVPLFQKLRISLVDLQQFYVGAITDEQLDAMIPDEIEPDDYDGDVKQWLRDHEEAIMGMITLTDIGPEAVDCDFAQVELRFALPDNTSNSLTAKEYHKFHRFLRLMRKTGWSIGTLDTILNALLPVPASDITEANMDAVFVQLLDRLANFRKIAGMLSYSEKKYPELLLVFDSTVDANLRQLQCAKILKMSIPDFEELSQITAIDPLANGLEIDEPALMKFIAIAQQLKAASLRVADLAYVLRHNDLTGKLDRSEASLLKDIKILRDTLNAVEKENSIASDTADVNVAKGKMQLVYDAATTNGFFDLLLDSKTYTAPFVTTDEGLPAKLTAVDGKLGFDPFQKEITYTGIVSSAAKTALENAADSLVLADVETLATQPELDAFIGDFKTALGQLFDAGDTDLTALADDSPELKTVYDAVRAETTPAAQMKTLVELLLPELITRLKRNGLQQDLIGILKTEPEVVGVLTAQKEVLESVADSNEAVLFDFTELAASPVFDTDQTYQFYLDAPATDDYLIYLAAPENTTVSLNIDGSVVIPNVAIDAGGEVSNAAPLSLSAGELHSAELTVASLPAGETVKLLWRTRGMEKQAVPASALYRSDRVDAAKRSLVRMWKAAQVQDILDLTPAELAYFAADNSETSGFLNLLDADGSIAGPDLASLWSAVDLLIIFKQLKKESEPEKNTWLQVLIDPDTKNSQNKFLLEYFNLWQEADLAAVLAHFGFSRADLSKLSVLKSVARAMAAVGSIYHPLADVLTWITGDPSHTLVAGIKTAVKEKVTDAVWLETMQTVNDPGAQSTAGCPGGLHLAIPEAFARSGHSRKTVRILSDRRRNGCLHEDFPDSSGFIYGPVVYPALPDEPGTHGRSGIYTGRSLGLDETLSSVGGQSESIPISGELAGARAAGQ